MENAFLNTMFLIFVGASLLATIALWTRQSLMVSYMVLGVVIGPLGLGWVSDAEVIHEIGDIGILFLLFLLGLHLDPRNLIDSLKKSLVVALPSALIFTLVGIFIAMIFGFSWFDAMIIGLAMIFSSTIISLKLVPSRILHNQSVGEMLISVLLIQDLIAIFVLLLLQGLGRESLSWMDINLIIITIPGFLIFAFLLERYMLQYLVSRFGGMREYLFLIAIAWCVGLSVMASALSLTDEVGAFIAGIAIAADSRFSIYLAEAMKPVRDFFLVLFFFSVGASFSLSSLQLIWLPCIILSAVVLVLKPATFHFLARQVNEVSTQSWELGFRLGQISEFSLLIAYIAANYQLLSLRASALIQGVALLTFVFSSFWVVRNYETPIGEIRQPG